MTPSRGSIAGIGKANLEDLVVGDCSSCTQFEKKKRISIYSIGILCKLNQVKLIDRQWSLIFSADVGGSCVFLSWSAPPRISLRCPEKSSLADGWCVSLSLSLSISLSLRSQEQRDCCIDPRAHCVASTRHAVSLVRTFDTFTRFISSVISLATMIDSST